MQTFHPIATALAAAAIALSTPSYAVNLCQSQTIDGGQTIIDGGTQTNDVFGNVTRNVPVGTSKAGPAHNGTAYTKAAFCPVGAAPGTCTGESLSESVAGIVYGDVTTLEKIGEETIDLPDTVIDNPDIPQYRIGVMIPATPWTPAKWVGTPWKNGTCP